MADIRLNPIKGVRWNGSILLWLISFFTLCLQAFTHDSIAALLIALLVKSKIIKKQETFPKWITEAWFIAALALFIFSLSNWDALSIGHKHFMFWFSIYSLNNSLAATLRDVFLAPNIHGGKIQIHNEQRWLLLTLLSLFEVVLSFAVIYLILGSQFSKTINNSFTAVYFSVITFLSLGYGDIAPNTTTARHIVVYELLYFLLFLSIKIPSIIGAFKFILYERSNKA
jgi:hypothetical protein